MRNIKYKMSEYTEAEYTGSKYAMDQAYNPSFDLAEKDCSVATIRDTSTLSDRDLDKLCGEHNEYLFLLRQVVDQSFDLIKEWAPARYCGERVPTLKMLELAKTAVERVAVCLMALRDVPEVDRYKGMGVEEVRLTKQFLQRLDAYLSDQNMVTLF